MVSITTVIQIHIQIQATLSFQIQTGLLISGFGQCRHEERETQFLKAYANHNMLTPPQRAAHLVMFKISLHLCRSRSENSTARLNGRKPNCLFNGLIPRTHLVKFSPSLIGMMSFTLQPHFQSGVLLWQMLIIISFPCGRKKSRNDNAPGLRHLSILKPYQIEW